MTFPTARWGSPFAVLAVSLLVGCADGPVASPTGPSLSASAASPRAERVAGVYELVSVDG